MKSIFFSLLVSLLFQYSFAQSGGTVTDINNRTISLDSLAGKKVLIIILPVGQDTAIIHQLIRFQSHFKDSIQVIGLVCLSNCSTSVSTIQSIYSEVIDSGIVITEGSTTSNPSTQRETMIKWLSDLNKNNRSIEPGLTGSKYFLSKGGKMYAQLGHEASLDARIVYNLARTKVPGEN